MKFWGGNWDFSFEGYGYGLKIGKDGILVPLMEFSESAHHLITFLYYFLPDRVFFFPNVAGSGLM